MTTRRHRSATQRHGRAAQPRRWDWSQLAALVSSLTALIALLFTQQSLRQTAMQINNEQQGQLTDRFSKAVDQLGSDAPDVQLGGVYALARIAHDSATDQPAVVSVLAGYLRRRAPNVSRPAGCGGPTTPPPIDIGVRAGLRVLLARAPAGDDGTEVDLTGVCLAGFAGPPNGDLRCAELNSADLDGIDLPGLDLAQAALPGATLRAAGLPKANLRGAVLDYADLGGADLRGADLTGADLFDADLTGADLTGADLSGVNLAHTRITGSQLARAYLDANIPPAPPTPC